MIYVTYGYFLSLPGITIDAPIGKVVVSLIQKANNFLPVGAETKKSKSPKKLDRGQINL